ncbi:P-type conjugative transfer protein TrbL [Eikenella halliae]|uniref:P-type conjugative transfer protein TrbL n=1 Tax=Eikenella halliae TaxID=1795832 RepID=UPI0007D0750C|nr:P-type conjugative transfer protein TrbL [Eikenella halliae]
MTTLSDTTALTRKQRVQRWLPFCLLLLGLLLFAAGAWGANPQPAGASEPKQQTVEQPTAASEPRIVSAGGEAVLINPPKNDAATEESMPVESDAQKFSMIEREFKDKAQKWSDVLVQRATWLFFALGAISLTWTGIQMVFRKGDIADFFAETVRFILFFGFFLWLLQNGIDIGTAIIDSFVQLGESAGQTGPITPSDVMLLAFQLWADTVKSTSQLSGAQLLAGILMLVLTTVFIALIAINFLLLKISVWLYLYAGIFVLGFGGSRWTSDMAVAYFKQLLNIGLQLMTMILMIGIAKNVMGEATAAVASMALFKFVVLLLVAITLFILSNKVPQMVGSIAGGGGSNGVGAFGGGAVMAATAAMTGAALELAGFAKAVRELKKDSASQGGKNQGGGTQSETGDSHRKSSATEALSDSGSADNSASQDGQPLIAEGNRNAAATAQATNVASGGNSISSPEASGGKADSGGQKGGDAGGRAASGQNDAAAAEGASKTIAMSTIQAISTAAGRILMNQTRGGKLANQIREERERRQQRERNPDHDPEA